MFEGPLTLLGNKFVQLASSLASILKGSPAVPLNIYYINMFLLVVDKVHQYMTDFNSIFNVSYEDTNVLGNDTCLEQPAPKC